MVMATQVTVKVPKLQWLGEFRKANAEFLSIAGNFIKNLIETKIERTWDSHYPVKVLVDFEGLSVLVVWGSGGDPPSILNEGGPQTARLPRDVESEFIQVSKTIPGILESVTPDADWVVTNRVIGTVIPREFDKTLLKEFVNRFDTNKAYALALRRVGIK